MNIPRETQFYQSVGQKALPLAAYGGPFGPWGTGGYEQPLRPSPNNVRPPSWWEGTPWPVVAMVLILLGILYMATGESRGHTSPTLDKIDDCCRVISSDRNDEGADSSGRRYR